MGQEGEVPERFQNDYDQIERSDGTVPSRREVRVQAAKDWGMHILSAVVLLLIAALVFAVVPAFNRMSNTMDDVIEGQAEAKVRGCILIATSTNGILPSSCLTQDPLTLYAGDVIDSLPTTGPMARNRLILCNALDRIGRADNDC